MPARRIRYHGRIPKRRRKSIPRGPRAHLTVQQSRDWLLALIRKHKRISLARLTVLERSDRLDFGPGVRAIYVLYNMQMRGHIFVNLKKRIIRVREAA